MDNLFEDSLSSINNLYLKPLTGRDDSDNTIIEKVINPLFKLTGAKTPFSVLDTPEGALRLHFETGGYFFRFGVERFMDELPQLPFYDELIGMTKENYLRTEQALMRPFLMADKYDTILTALQLVPIIYHGLPDTSPLKVDNLIGQTLDWYQKNEWKIDFAHKGYDLMDAGIVMARSYPSGLKSIRKLFRKPVYRSVWEAAFIVDFFLPLAEQNEDKLKEIPDILINSSGKLLDKVGNYIQNYFPIAKDLADKVFPGHGISSPETVQKRFEYFKGPLASLLTYSSGNK
ncbi:hypothetical protein JXC34_01685, partial [Candidatus Woesearchaeota archaeon]|nr:hypothetical protein [Candidatus Woesearchaeota archaeon]